LAIVFGDPGENPQMTDLESFGFDDSFDADQVSSKENAMQPPWRQTRGKWMVSLVNSHPNSTSRR
jgi:hypothetical protein